MPMAEKVPHHPPLILTTKNLQHFRHPRHQSTVVSKLPFRVMKFVSRITPPHDPQIFAAFVQGGGSQFKAFLKFSSCPCSTLSFLHLRYCLTAGFARIKRRW